MSILNKVKNIFSQTNSISIASSIFIILGGTYVGILQLKDIIEVKYYIAIITFFIVLYISLFVILIMFVRNLFIIKNRDDIYSIISDVNNSLENINMKIANEETKQIFTKFQIKDISEIMLNESTLKNGDEVIIYTPYFSSEQDVEKTVRENIEKGVKYSVIYYRDTKERSGVSGNKIRSMKRLYRKNGGKLIKIGRKYRNSFDKFISENIEFDLFIHINNQDKSNKKITSYYCVNFSPIKECVFTDDATPHEQCKVCRKANNMLFYQKLSDKMADNVYKKFLTILGRRIDVDTSKISSNQILNTAGGLTFIGSSILGFTKGLITTQELIILIAIVILLIYIFSNATKPSIIKVKRPEIDSFLQKKKLENSLSINDYYLFYKKTLFDRFKNSANELWHFSQGLEFDYQETLLFFKEIEDITYYFFYYNYDKLKKEEKDATAIAVNNHKAQLGTTLGSKIGNSNFIKLSVKKHIGVIPSVISSIIFMVNRYENIVGVDSCYLAIMRPNQEQEQENILFYELPPCQRDFLFNRFLNLQNKSNKKKSFRRKL